MPLTAEPPFAAIAYADLETIADGHVVKFNNECFSRETPAAIAPVRRKVTVDKDRFPAISSVAAVAVPASGSMCAGDRLAFIEPTAIATRTSIAAARLPAFLFVFDKRRPAAAAALAAVGAKNGQTFDTARTSAAATAAGGSLNDEQPVPGIPRPRESP